MAAFAREVLAGKSSPGVWYPEEPEAVRDRRLLLDLAAKGADRYLTCSAVRLALGCRMHAPLQRSATVGLSLKMHLCACRFELNRPPWALSGDPKQIGMGFYY